MKQFIILILTIISLHSVKGQIDTTAVNQKKKLIIGVKDTPPFIIKTGSTYSGVSIDLWENIADQFNVKYEYKEYDLVGLLDALENNEIDVCINPLTVTSDRLKKFDFTQPFFISNLAIAVSNKSNLDYFSALYRFFSVTVNFIKAVSLLLGVIIGLGIIIWLVERKKNTKQFKKGFRGIFDGIWWAAVTMTTVGYGDKVPKSRFGRIVGIIWMYTAIIIISSLTASIAASLTVNEFTSIVENVEDLRKVTVGTVGASSSKTFLQNRHIKTRNYKTAIEGMNALRNGTINAFVYDDPIIRYLIHNNEWYDELYVVPNQFNSDYYSFSLPHDHYLFNEINPVLIKELESHGWKAILNKYSLEQ